MQPVKIHIYSQSHSSVGTENIETTCDAGHQHTGGDRNDIMSAKEKEATSKTAFTFLAPLTKVPPAIAGSRAR